MSNILTKHDVFDLKTRQNHALRGKCQLTLKHNAFKLLEITADSAKNLSNITCMMKLRTKSTAKTI